MTKEGGIACSVVGRAIVTHALWRKRISFVVRIIQVDTITIGCKERKYSRMFLANTRLETKTCSLA